MIGAAKLFSQSEVPFCVEFVKERYRHSPIPDRTYQSNSIPVQPGDGAVRLGGFPFVRSELKSPLDRLAVDEGERALTTEMRIVVLDAQAGILHAFRDGSA